MKFSPSQWKICQRTESQNYTLWFDRKKIHFHIHLFMFTHSGKFCTPSPQITNSITHLFNSKVNTSMFTYFLILGIGRWCLRLRKWLHPSVPPWHGFVFRYCCQRTGYADPRARWLWVEASDGTLLWWWGLHQLHPRIERGIFFFRKIGTKSWDE